MIRLYNHTRIPDRPMRDVLTWAAHKIGVRGDVFVKVTVGTRLRAGAHAATGFPYLGFLRGSGSREGSNGKLMGRHSGYIVCSLPTPENAKPYELDAAEWFLRVALHEMSHVHDIREGIHNQLVRMEQRSFGKRRMAHDSRPCELRAENRVYDALQDSWAKRRADELVIALALAIEAAGK